MIEQWKTIEGFEGLYEVSSHGRVRSLDRVVKQTRKRTTFDRKMKGRILKQTKATDYPMVTLCKGTKDDYKHHVSVHSLVAKAFIPNADKLLVVNHKNLDKFNNHVDNLEWTTWSGNIQHASDNGRQLGAFGEKHYTTKLTEDDVRQIRERARDITRKELAKEYSMPISTINSIVNRTNWKHVV